MNQYKFSISATIRIYCSILCSAASAATITFEDVPVPPAQITTGNISHGGFDFSLIGLASSINSSATYCSPLFPDNDTYYVLAPYNFSGDATLTMTKSGSGFFNFNGFGGTGSFNFHSNSDYISNQIDVVGLLQQTKTAARGFRTVKNFVAIVYLRMSKLKHLPQNPLRSAVSPMHGVTQYRSGRQFPYKTA